MIKTKTRTIEIEEPVTITCDRCGKTYDIESGGLKDDLEAQEFIRIKHLCGYGSIFGDGNTLHLDLCQRCANVLLGGLFHYNEDS